MNQANQKRLRKIIYSAMFAALVFAGTWVSIPMPIGNINLSDGMLLVGAWMLGGPWAVVAGAMGATLVDLMGAYAVYAPGTLVIKALMAVVAILLVRLLSKTKLPRPVSLVLSAVAAECVMIAGYFAYEALFLGLGWGALASIPFNAVQGGAAIVLSVSVYSLLYRAGVKAE